MYNILLYAVYAEILVSVILVAGIAAVAVPRLVREFATEMAHTRIRNRVWRELDRGQARAVWRAKYCAGDTK